jgi:hypothetical protein
MTGTPTAERMPASRTETARGPLALSAGLSIRAERPVSDTSVAKSCPPRLNRLPTGKSSLALPQEATKVAAPSGS